MMELPKIPKPRHWFTNDEGTVRATGIWDVSNSESNAKHFEDVKKGLEEYEWIDGDFLMTTHPKTGTHFLWEIMNMLLSGSTEYNKKSKSDCQIDMCPLQKLNELFPPPRILNTHFRLDLLPKVFRGRKTVCAFRNPKDTVVSFYQQMKNMYALAPDSDLFKAFSQMTFSEFMRLFLFEKEDMMFGNYFDYVDYMWSIRNEPHILIVFYEDMTLNPVSTIQKINEFMGMSRSPELVEQIADATSFSKMGPKKLGSSAGLIDKYGGETDLADDPLAKLIYRKGMVGDWKNHFTVADNELFDSVLDKWTAGKEIPFIYE